MFAPEAIAPGPATARSASAIATRTLLGGLVVYFGFHVAFRVLASGTVELDEAEQVLLAQDWRWGYGAQPPLYTWLQIGFFSLFGQNVFALSLLKNSLLFGTFALVYSTARLVTTDGQTPVLAMLSLFFVPQFAWESHRDLTHSVAATTFAAATLYAMIRLLKFRRPMGYLVAGFFAAMGILAKYNFAIFSIALLAAILSMKDFRPVFKSGWMLAGLAVFVFVTAGHFLWLAGHGAPPGARDLARSHMAALRYWLTAVLSFSGPLLVAMVIIRFRAPVGEPGRLLILLSRTLLLALALSLLVVVVWKARFKDRWFQPVLFALPLFFALWARPRLSPRGFRILSACAAIVAFATLILIPVIPMAAKMTTRPTRLNLPYASLAAALRANNVTPAAIVADSRLTGGNMKLQFPAAAVTAPELPRTIRVRERLLIIWDAKKAGPPNTLVALVKDLGLSKQLLAQPSFLELPLQFMAHEKARWNYVFLRDSASLE